MMKRHKQFKTLEWLQSPELRKHVLVGLNKGEACWEHITLTGDYVWNLNQKANFYDLRLLQVKSFIKKQ